MTGWHGFSRQIGKDARLWLLLCAYLLFFRFAFLVVFRGHVDAATAAGDVARAVLQGLRFDAKIVTTFVLPPLLFGAFAGPFGRERMADRFRRGYATAIIAVLSVVCTVAFGYFSVYGDLYNSNLYNFFADDPAAIVVTIWKSYHPILYISAMTALGTAAVLLMRRFLAADGIGARWLAVHANTLPRRIAVILILVCLLAVTGRGTVWGARLKTQEAAVTRDEFLNKSVVNAVYAFWSSYQDYTFNHAVDGLKLFIPDGNIERAARTVSPSRQPGGDIDSYLRRTARGHNAPRPRHVFLVIMESFGAWSLMPEYASLGLAENLSKFAREGCSFERFLPSGPLTAPSYSSIMTSIPSAMVEIIYQDQSQTVYPSSLAAAFKRLGYRTRLFYGGFLSWHRIGDFSRRQGFEELYGAPHMGAAAKNEWGVDDEYLFRFAAETVTDDVPSFNVILTTSNHPPFTVDVKSKGFPLDAVPPAFASRFGDPASIAMFGHTWYSDQCAGSFVREVSKKLARPLFAFTGDHPSIVTSRNEKLGYAARAEVPFILYGPTVLKGIKAPSGAAGSHLDIAPTLIELAAPRGFAYYSFGQDLLARDRRQMGIGWWNIIGPDYLFSVAAAQLFPLPGRTLPAAGLPNAADLMSQYNAYYGLAWVRVSRGPELR